MFPDSYQVERWSDLSRTIREWRVQQWIEALQKTSIEIQYEAFNTLKADTPEAAQQQAVRQVITVLGRAHPSQQSPKALYNPPRPPKNPPVPIISSTPMSEVIEVDKFRREHEKLFLLSAAGKVSKEEARGLLDKFHRLLFDSASIEVRRWSNHWSFVLAGKKLWSIYLPERCLVVVILAN